MRKTYKMQDLECAHCAAKMEAAIQQLPGVTKVSISFLTQKLTIEGDDAQFEQIVKQAAELCKKVEPDCKILF